MYKHSFAILAYKDSPYIEECIKSIKNQTIQSNYFICTSTPSPYLKKLSQKYDCPLLVNSFAGGIGNDWTFAYKSAKDSYVTLAHQDDIYENTYTQTMLNLANKRPKGILFHSNYYEIDEKGQKRKSVIIIIKRFLITCLNKRWLLKFGTPICCPSVMLNKEIIKKFAFNNSLQLNLDWDAWEKLSRLDGEFIYTSKKLLLHRIHQQSETSHGINSGRRYQEDKIMLEKMWPKKLAAMVTNFQSIAYKANFK